MKKKDAINHVSSCVIGELVGELTKKIVRIHCNQNTELYMTNKNLPLRSR